MIRFLANCRFLMIIPVLGCVILTLAVVIMGFGRIVTMLIHHIGSGELTEKAAKKLSLVVIETIDLFLIGTVSYITAVGLYKLFISPADVKLPMRLKIESLKDLEFKIFGVIVAALAVAFLGKAAGTDDPDGLLDYGAGIALVITALAFFMWNESKKTDA
ncbi:MAG: YqhA family protein [Planctomycetota bacterium]|jgi:uncharacterized membrane protein YqhA